ncbi:cytochrome b5, partial [Pseudovirgaria hyperparasitica]
PQTGPISLTDAELAAYDGTDPNKPVYVALNGSIYDVTDGRGVYGPGGSYHTLAGRDATRAFITGCFDTDLHPDVRGAELLYVPVTPAEAAADGRTVEDKYWAALEGARELSSGEQKIRRQAELRSARKSVDAVVENWAVMFSGGRGKNYFKVGEVKREEGWMEKRERPVLCKDAQIRRPIRMGL